MTLLSRFASFRSFGRHGDQQLSAASAGSMVVGRVGSTAGASLQGEPLDEPDAGPDDGIYAVIKNTNYWFNRELSMLEQSAREDAARWAEKGLPHHAAPRTEPLPVEQALAARCTEILRQWAERVRTKMQDAIERSGQIVAERMVALRFSLKQLENTQLELLNKEREAAELRESLRERETPFGYRPFMGRRVAIILLTLLALVEFVANFPVFRILLPLNSSLAQQTERLAREAVDKGAWTGLYHMWRDLLLRPEALAVSLVVVITIVVLGDSLGGSLRPLFALHEQENPSAAVGIRSHKRQHRARTVLCSLGIVCSVAFLYFARFQIPTTAMSRVAADSAVLAHADARLGLAVQQRSPGVGRLQLERDDAARALAIRQEEASYAETVQRSNTPILLLNIALLLSAAVVGYSTHAEDLKDQLSEDPRYVEVRSAINRLRHETLQHHQSVREASAEVRIGISRVHHLLAARPLQEWRAKAERLQGVIPLFRSENARHRSLDPVEILAFQSDPELVLPTVDEATFRPPSGFETYAEEFAELNEHFARVSKQLEISSDTEAAA